MNRLVLLFCLIGHITLAQNNVLLTGQVNNDSIGILYLEINKRYINNTVEEYSAAINNENNFGLACRIEIPQLVTLRYGDQQCQLFLEPNDSLYIEFDGTSFPQKIGFGQRAKDNNILWHAYQKAFPKDPVLFRYRQYRKGRYYYKIHEDLDKMMHQKKPEDFHALLNDELVKKQSIYQLFAEDKNRSLSEEFSTFIQTEFLYDKWLKLLTYGDVYKGRHRLDSSFLNFVDTVLVQNDLSLGNDNYREFILAMMHLRCRKENTTGKSYYTTLYNYSKNYLEGRTKYFIMAKVLATALSKEAPKIIMPIYEDFIKENPYYELDKVVLDPFQKASQFTAGMPAPAFRLQDVDGNWVSLSQFKGKVIYLDFWASWCRPCIEKIESLQSFEPKFANKDVVFLHVSLDRSKDKWMQTIQEKNLKGTHLFFDPMSSQITTDYDILSVPKFFLITKAGNFAYTPSAFDSKELELTLLKLLQN